MKRIAIVALAAVAAAVLVVLAQGTVGAVTPPKPLPRPVVYVESQGLCYDSIVTAQDLPDRGRFQTLEPDPEERCGEGSLITEFGPGDQGYVGGRWEMETMDGMLVHFLCPLIGGGYPPPA